MARMLGRYETPGCCPGRRSGWTRNRRLFGPDCSRGFTDPRHFKRREQRAFRAEAQAALADNTREAVRRPR
jgi:hypothetical protein